MSNSIAAAARRVSTITSASKCVGCEGLVAPLPPSEINAQLPLLTPLWRPTSDFQKMYRTLRTSNFKTAMHLLNTVADIAEAEAHHPDMAITQWNHVRFDLWTHAVGGITENDLIMAVKIDAVIQSLGISDK